MAAAPASVLAAAVVVEVVVVAEVVLVRWRFRFFSQPISQQTTDYRTCGGADGASYCETILTILGGCDASPDTATDNGTCRGTF